MKEDGLFILALTGSIGMGKTTTAGFFREEGVPVWDADAAVHRLYSPGGAAVDVIRDIAPEAVRQGSVDRAGLKKWIAQDPQALKKIEQVVHPLVAEDRREFFELARARGELIVVVDIPLLFETGGQHLADATLVVSAPPQVQKDRVLAREGMTEAHFQTILARQMPDAEKRCRADYVIETTTPEDAKHAVRHLLRDLRNRMAENA